ncbi:MAG: DUF4064 domain-containing protein [Sporolactobacillus sp.]
MKRKSEFVIAVIAAVTSFLALLSGVRILSAAGDAHFKALIKSRSDHYGNIQLTASQLNSTFHVLQLIGSTMIILSAVCIVLAIIALVWLRRADNRVTAAGWLLVVAAVISLAEIIPCIFYAISGIMTLVRKPSEPSDS